MLRQGLVFAAAVAAFGLAACDTRAKAPTDKGVCYTVTLKEGQPPKFNKLAENQATLENCIAQLENVRVRFLRMGGSRRELTGAYQGQFLFVDPTGVAISRSLEGGRFYAFTRTPDGQLVIPGAVYSGPAQPEQK